MNLLNILKKDPDMKVLAGENGLEREVSTVSVMDAPDIHKWMKGGEFLITSGYIINQNSEKTRELIIELEKAGAAGFGIKLNRYISALPEDIINLANELNFPIIYIPIDYAWADIINFVLTKVLNEKKEQLMLSERIHKSFTDLVIKGKDVQDIIHALAEILNKSVVVYDLFFNHTYSALRSEEEKQLIMESTSNAMLQKFSHYSLSIENQLYGYLIILESQGVNNLKEFEKSAIEHASTVLKLDIQRRISNYRIEQKYYDEFVQDLLMDNIKTKEEMINRAKLYGYRLEKGLFCLIVDIDDFKEKFIHLEEDTNLLNEQRNRIFQRAINIIKKSFPLQILYTSFSDSIVFLIEFSYDNNLSFIKTIKRVSDEVRERIKNHSSYTVTVGLGEYKHSLKDIHLSFNEAKQAVKIGRIINERNQTVYYEELEAYRVLISAAQTQEAKAFSNRYLQELKQYDLKNQTSLIKTLDCLVNNDWNMKDAANDLYIHYNTIKYRVQNIKDITGLNINDREQKFKVELYFKLNKLRST